MKRIIKSLLFSLIAIIATVTLYSCEEHVSPTLEVKVFNYSGVPDEDIRIITHPCWEKQCTNGRLDSAYVRIQTINAEGIATFEFPNSAVLDVLVTVLDSPAVSDTMILDRTVVSIERKKLKKDKKNVSRIVLSPT